MNDRRRLFCEEYVKDFNATRAAIRAGFSKKTARKQGSRLLTFVDVQVEIRNLAQERVMRQEEVRLRVAEQARVSMADFLDDEGGLDWKAIKALGHLVKKITPTKWGYTLELVDGQAALFKQADILGMIKSRSVLENPDGSALDLTRKNVTIYIPDNGRQRNTSGK